MNFLRDALNFLRREKIWTFLFVFLVVIYVLVSQRAEKVPKKARSEAVEKLQAAEGRLKEEIRNTGGVQRFLEARPRLFKAFVLFTALILGIFFSGLVLDFSWLARPQWRRRILTGAGPPEARTWGLGTIFKTILLFVLASLSLSFLLALLKRILFPGVSPNFLVLLHTTLSDLLCIAFVIGFIVQTGGHWKDLGFRGVRLWKDLWIGVAGYMAIIPVFFLVLFFLLIFIQLMAYEPPPHPLVEVFLEEEHSPLIIAYSLFLACVVGPILEEIFFRGFCYPALKKRWGAGWGLVLSAAFFSLIHQNAFAFLPVFVLGLGLGYLYEKRGTLVPSIALHIVHNSVFIGYFFLAKEALIRS